MGLCSHACWQLCSNLLDLINGRTDICRLGLQRKIKLVIGIPMLTSARSLGFWLRLCAASRLAGAAEQLQRFQTQEAAGAEAMRAFCYDYMSQLIGKVCAGLSTPMQPL